LFYLLPARGQPQKLLHAIEPGALDVLPGAAATYSSWRSRDRELGRILRGLRTVAMDFSPRNEIPTTSRTDAGTVELVRSMGPEVVSAAELVAWSSSTLSADELAGQARAAALVSADLDATAQEAARRLKAGNPATERELQDFVLARWAQEGLSNDGGRPIVAVDAHTALPHYMAPAQGSAVAGQNSVLLLDFGARLANDPRAVYADLTRVYFLGSRTPDEVARVADVVFKARDAAVELLKYRAEWSKPVTGAEVDGAARKVVTDAGFGERFLHRTGHSIGPRVHGDGVNNDDFETHDARRHLANTCFSVEPGIYTTGRFGVRSEIDVCLVKDAAGKVAVDVRGGPLQTSVPALLAN
jgi:Xaa-Pro aminopeptidase